MSYSLNSSRGVIKGIIYGTTIGDIKADTRSLDYGSNRFLFHSPYITPISPFQGRCASFWDPVRRYQGLRLLSMAVTWRFPNHMQVDLQVLRGSPADICVLGNHFPQWPCWEQEF